MTVLIPRQMTESVKNTFQNFPCVFINGPRQSGKTTLAKLVLTGEEHTYINFDDTAKLAIASGSPEEFLSGYDGKLILDEIQLIPQLYRALKSRIDNIRWEKKGQAAGLYILTGSTNILALPQLADALVGRMIIKTLYPLSASEVYGGKGDFLQRLKEGNFRAGTVSQFNVVEAMERATFPEIRQSNDLFRTEWFQSYISTLIQRDVKHIMDIEKVTLLSQLLRLLSSRIGGLLNEADLSRSVKENAVTTKRYLTILNLLFLTITVSPWFRNIGKRFIKAPKSYLIDINMACYMLGNSLKDIEKNDPQLFGHLLENFVVLELLKQISEPIHQSGLYHFRTGEGKEVDLVIEYSDQKLLGIEVKASDQVSLKDCAGLFELQKLVPKDFLMGCVLYRGREIMKISDKIWALPISLLWS